MISYMVGKLAPNSSHLTRGLVKYVPGRGYFRAVPSLNGDKYFTSPAPPIFELVEIPGPILHCGRCHTLDIRALDDLMCSAARCCPVFLGNS